MEVALYLYSNVKMLLMYGVYMVQELWLKLL